MTTMTAAASLDALDKARALACAIGNSPADEDTFQAAGPLRQDSAGNLYAIASGAVTEGWAGGVADRDTPLPARDWPCDLALAEAGRAVLDVGDLSAPPAATPGRIAVILGADGATALAAMGLREVESEAPPA